MRSPATRQHPATDGRWSHVQRLLRPPWSRSASRSSSDRRDRGLRRRSHHSLGLLVRPSWCLALDEPQHAPAACCHRLRMAAVQPEGRTAAKTRGDGANGPVATASGGGAGGRTGTPPPPVCCPHATPGLTTRNLTQRENLFAERILWRPHPDGPCRSTDAGTSPDGQATTTSPF
jgi:hypothetical protein